MRRTENSSTKLMAMAALVIGFCLWSAPSALANHPVLVEGNCDSPVPGTTIINTPGTCGDFDGDGRIGTAEDSDGADRIFGTINAALGNVDLGATINATTAGLNGSITIVTSGRFAEQIYISPTSSAGRFPNVGHVQIEAAPGVHAEINAVLQGDPAGGNNTRQTLAGFFIDMPADRHVTLRNLTIRNWAEGLRAIGNSRVLIDNCRFENNRDFAVRVLHESRVAVTRSAISDTGFRINPAVNNLPNPGTAIQFENSSRGSVTKTSITGSFAFAINNQTGVPVTYYEVTTFDNGSGPFAGPVTRVDF